MAVIGDDQLAGDFVDHHELRIVLAGNSSIARSRPRRRKDPPPRRAQLAHRPMAASASTRVNSAIERAGRTRSEWQRSRRQRARRRQRAPGARSLGQIAETQAGGDGQCQARLRRLSAQFCGSSSLVGLARIRGAVFVLLRRRSARRLRISPRPSCPGRSGGSARCKKGNRRRSRNRWACGRSGTGVSSMHRVRERIRRCSEMTAWSSAA